MEATKSTKVEDLSSEELGIVAIQEGDKIMQSQQAIILSQNNLRVINQELMKRKERTTPEKQD